MDRAAETDLEYVRRVAEAGAAAPLLGGRFMAWWGGLAALAYALHHFALRGAFGPDLSVFGYLWIGFAILGLAGQWLILRTMPRKPGSGSAANRSSPTVWGAGAGAIAAFLLGTIAAVASGASAAMFDFSVPLVFAVYGCALAVTGALAANRVMSAAAFGAIVMVGVAAAFISDPNRYLFAAAGAALTVLLPGLLLLRAEPAHAG